jgi:hypothetical protein
MRAAAIHLAEHFIGDWTRIILKKRAVFGQHREFSGAVVPIVSIQYATLTWG